MDMGCIVVTEIGSFEMAQRPVAAPGTGEVLVQVAVTGLCRTDLKLIRAGHRDLVLPRIPGEEVVGRVVATGPGVSAYAAEDLVYVYPGEWCGECPACRRGADNLCRAMRIMGFHRDGGFAEYVTVPARSLIPVPDGLAPEAAVFAEPLSCCLNALEQARLHAGDSVAVWGAGPAGTLLARAARAHGAEAVNVDPDPARRAPAVAERCPAGAFDVCVVAVGARAAYAEAVTRLRPRGRLVVFSGLPPGDDRLDVDLNRLHYHEQTLVGAYGCAYRHGVAALNLIAGGGVPVADLVSHRMPLGRLGEALDLVAERRCMKILLTPGGGPDR